MQLGSGILDPIKFFFQLIKNITSRQHFLLKFVKLTIALFRAQYKSHTYPAHTNHTHIPFLQITHISHSYKSHTYPVLTNHTHIPFLQITHISRSYKSHTYPVLTNHTHIPFLQITHISRSYKSNTYPVLTNHTHIPFLCNRRSAVSDVYF